LPLLTLFLFGIVQFGIAYDNKQSLNSAAREGARFAALPSSTVLEIKQRATGSFIGAGSGTVTVFVRQPSTSVINLPDGATPCSAPTGDEVVAVITRLAHPLEIPFWGQQTINMESRAEFRCE